jgi:tripartite-type tricarboxylate transporter receptor subunit TctC
MKAGSAIACLLAIAVGLFGAVPATAQSYPGTRPVTLSLGFAAGGGADILARYYAEKLAPALGSTVIVENKAGANGNIAAQGVAKAKNDGYTLLFAPSAGLAGGTYLYKNLGYEPRKDFDLVAPLCDLPFFLAVGPDSPAKSVADLTALLKSKADSSYGTANTTSKAATELYKSLAGITSVEVPYRSTVNAIPELGNGTLDFMFLDGAFGLGQADAGKIRLLGVTSKTRFDSAPQVPTMQESGVNFGFTVWWMVAAPAGTPAPIVNQLNRAFNSISTTAETKTFLLRNGSLPMTGSPADSKQRLIDDTAQWGLIAKLGNIEPQ